ncbi:unnamed protein product [Ceratitis capitata]|uniref:(Mediterranean fruit fly) hypothetical protein n=1 Tax=Ceratitis capitata TaxID=7213 RepID=A0A811UQQ7_CERCA|nr:unnamed protein product [Ceratitis capitata]
MAESLSPSCDKSALVATVVCTSRTRSVAETPHKPLKLCFSTQIDDRGSAIDSVHKIEVMKLEKLRMLSSNSVPTEDDTQNSFPAITVSPTNSDSERPSQP